NGRFTFSFTHPEPLLVLITDHAGHRKEVRLDAATLARGGEPGLAALFISSLTAPPTPLSTTALFFAENIERADDLSGAGKDVPTQAGPERQTGLKDVVVGVGFVLALAAFVLSVRNAQQLRRLTQAGKGNGR